MRSTRPVLVTVTNGKATMTGCEHITDLDAEPVPGVVLGPFACWCVGGRRHKPHYLPDEVLLVREDDSMIGFMPADSAGDVLCGPVCGSTPSSISGAKRPCGLPHRVGRRPDPPYPGTALLIAS